MSKKSEIADAEIVPSAPKPPKLEKDLAQLIFDRADDTATLEATAGPKSIHAVRMALRHIADVMSGGRLLKRAPRLVRKRTPDAPPVMPELRDE